MTRYRSSSQTVRPGRSPSAASSTWVRASSTAKRVCRRERPAERAGMAQRQVLRRSKRSSPTRSTPRRSPRHGAQQLPGVSVNEWQALNTDILAGLIAQSGCVGYMIQVFVLIAVALGIASTLAIAAVQKTRQIGILKAMGLADRPGRAHLPVAGAILGIVGSFWRRDLVLWNPRAVRPVARAVRDQPRPEVRRDLVRRSASPWHCSPRSFLSGRPRSSTRSR